MLQALERYIREHKLLQAGDRVGVAVSGGADSVALLRALHELRHTLGIVISAVHLNHMLREAAAEDQKFVEALSAELGIERFVETRDVAELSRNRGLSLEAAGRAARYEFFGRLLAENKVDRIATAHTFDDQAETVLLRLIRGAGPRGLSGVLRQRHGLHPGQIIRPMLGTRREEVEQYLRALGQPWREDESNRDPQFLRNRVRHELLPWLEREFNPRLRQRLNDTAQIVLAEDEYLREQAQALLNSLAANGMLRIGELSRQPLAIQRRVLRMSAERHEVRLDFQHLEKLREFVLKNVAGRLLLPNDLSAEVSRDGSGHALRFLEQRKTEAVVEYVLPVPGAVDIPEWDMHLCARLVTEVSELTSYNPFALLNPKLLTGSLVVRGFVPGDRFHPLHASREEKLKRLLQELRVPQSQRARWPVLLSGDRIVWVKGMNAAVHAASKPYDEVAVAIEIREGSGNLHDKL